ncbi:MAG: DUF445 domain-containing protein [Oscillospiraceae bacterium]
MIIKIILTLLISACIGYATNYIAVKMLFRPLKPVFIKGKRLPFTPGIIPKGKPRLAKALGNAVSSTLLTDKDIHKALLDENTKKKVSSEICCSVFNDNGRSIKETLSELFGESDYENARAGIKNVICLKITDGLKKLDIGEIIISEGGAAIKEKFSSGLLSMFINDELIASVAKPIGDKINEYIDGNGKTKIDEVTDAELSLMEEKSLSQLLNDMGVTQEKLTDFIENVYENLLADKLLDILASVDIQQIVEDKVNDMDIMELEDLVMSVMKTELNAVINLGALIGLIIGILNVLVNIMS